MSFINKSGEITYLTDEKIQNAGGLRHMFTGRRGGVSTGSLKSLNMGINRHDLRENILENYKRACAIIDVPYENCVLAAQTHTTNIRVVTEIDVGKGLMRDTDIEDTDGLVTNIPNIPLVIFYADCVPILLYDPIVKAVGVLHCGWRGSANGMAAKGVTALEKNFGSDPSNIIASIGPSIGMCHFETGIEVAKIFDRLKIHNCVKYSGEKAYIDLWTVNKTLLMREGVKEENISVSSVCTVCNKETFFSHRGCGSDTGRMALIACLV